MQKHITKIENLTKWTVTPTNNRLEILSNLSIDKLGHFNLFSGKEENGYTHFISYLNVASPQGVRVNSNFLYDTHYSELHTEIRKRFLWITEENLQIFATTQRYDVIQAFAEVAQEYKDVEAYYYRLGRSGRNSNNGQSIVTVYDTDRLLEVTKQNIEVR